MRHLLDLAALLLTRLLARVFYREVEARGLEHVPAPAEGEQLRP